MHVWTIDDPDEMRELLDRGVDGLFTDRTDILRDVLVERGAGSQTPEGRVMSDAGTPAGSPTSAPGPGPGAEGLVLVRLGELGLRHDVADGALRAVHDQHRRARRRLPTPDETCSRPSACSACTSRPGSLPFYLTSFATIASAFLLPIVGAMVDRSAHKKRHMAIFAWTGAAPPR